MVFKLNSFYCPFLPVYRLSFFFFFGAVPEAVVLVADLLLDYDQFDLALWNNVLLELMKLNLHTDLARVLGVVAGVPQLWSIPRY